MSEFEISILTNYRPPSERGPSTPLNFNHKHKWLWLSKIYNSKGIIQQYQRCETCGLINKKQIATTKRKPKK